MEGSDCNFVAALIMMIVLLFLSVGGAADKLGLPWWLFGAFSFAILANLLWSLMRKK
ncbi:MAG: hypothetical protein KKG92_11770 [Gammaproteobacteria bacterium]|nr:hypothetical protein [Gammaproteobacteria bacterium]